MKIILLMSLFCAGTSVFADAWMKGDVVFDGNVIDFPAATREPAFHIEGTGWVRTFPSGHVDGKIVVNGRNYDCDSAASGYNIKTHVTEYLCLFNADKFLQFIKEGAQQEVRFKDSIATLESYFAKVSDKRAMVLIGHDSATAGVLSESSDFLEPKAKTLQTTVVSSAGQVKPF